MQEQNRFRNRNVHDQILKYYKVNEVQKFTYSRPMRKGEKDSDNEFATMWLERTNLVTSYPLPGILRYTDVTVFCIFINLILIITTLQLCVYMCSTLNSTTFFG